MEQLNIEHFEKDDDSNGHIDFITATSVSFVLLPWFLSLIFSKLKLVFNPSTPGVH